MATFHCAHKGSEVTPKECLKIMTKRRQLCENANCPFVKDTKVEAALRIIGLNETVNCRGTEILARACLLKQANNPDACGKCAEPTRMCRKCGKTKKEALTAFDLELGLCLECATKSGANPLPATMAASSSTSEEDTPHLASMQLADPPAPNPDQANILPSPAEDHSPPTTEANDDEPVTEDIKAMQEKVPWLSDSEAGVLLENNIGSVEKLLELGMEGMIGITMGRQHGHIRRNWPDWEAGLLKTEASKEEEPSENAVSQDGNAADKKAEPPPNLSEAELRKIWGVRIYSTTMKKLAAHGIRDWEHLAAFTPYQMIDMGFIEDISFLHSALRYRKKDFKNPDKKESPQATPVALMPEEAQDANNGKIERLAKEIDGMQDVLSNFMQTVQEGLRETVVPTPTPAGLTAEDHELIAKTVVAALKEALPQTEGRTQPASGKINREELEKILGAIALRNIPEDLLSDLLQ